MHNFYIVHCDIKPENVMLSPSYHKLVFVDFGFSDILKKNPGKRLSQDTKELRALVALKFFNYLKVKHISLI